MGNKCSQHDCKLEVYEDKNKCVLHCEKSNEYNYLNNIKLYKIFYEELKEILEKNNKVVLSFLVFPEYDTRDFDYVELLKQCKSIYFNYCEFHTSHIDLENTKCFFQDCKFHKYWTLFDYGILTNMDNVIYQACIFYEDVSPYSSETIGEEVLYRNSQFDYTCRFEKELRFDNVKFKKPLFYSAQNNYLTHRNFIKALTFNNCTFEQPFKLNNYEIDYFICNDTVFKNKSKFEFKLNEVENFLISNTNFKALVDCYKTKFKLFFVEKSIFEKFTGFEKCEFGEKNKEKNNNSSFQYATFLDFVNFRESKFYNGLDLQNANLKEYPNFLDIDVEPKNTNRETFRIIKHSFDKVGNTIEANKFFAYEMDKERKNIKFWKSPSKWFSLQLNYFISDFGQTFLIPLLWILTISMFHSLVISWLGNYELTILNELVQNIMPYKKLLKDVKGKEFISLFFGVIYMILIYNVIIALKRITKR